MRLPALRYLNHFSRRERWRRAAQHLRQAWKEITYDDSPHRHTYDSKNGVINLGRRLNVVLCRCGRGRLFGHLS